VSKHFPETSVPFTRIKKVYINLEMHVALDTWGMADICGTAVDLYVEHALGVNDTVANDCVVFDVCMQSHLSTVCFSLCLLLPVTSPRSDFTVSNLLK
jgi:hypothetical protein